MALLATNLLIVIAIAVQAANCSTTTIKKADSEVTVPKELCCAEACEKKFGQNSKLKGEWFACHRGCRFFSLLELLSDGQPEASIRSSCKTACDDAYNKTLDKACKHGCNHQTLVRPRKSEAAVVESLQRMITAPEAWAPGFIFRIGFARSDQATIPNSDNGQPQLMPNNGDEDPFGSSLQMIKKFFSGFWNRLSPQAIWSSRTSYAYLLGHGSDGKEKLVFLPHLTDTLSTTTARHQPQPHPTPVSHSPIKSTTPLVIQRLSNSAPRRAIIGRAGKHRANTKKNVSAPKMVKTEVPHSDVDIVVARSEPKTPSDDQSFWQCLKPSRDGGISSGIFLVLGLPLLLVSFWFCCSTVFFTRQLSRSEEELRRKGYRRLDRDDPEVAKLLSDVDDLSEDEDVYILTADVHKSSPPPSYEESLSNCEILIPTKAQPGPDHPLV